MKDKYTLLLIPPKHGQARQVQFTLRGRRILVTGLIICGVLLTGLVGHNLYLTHTLKAQEVAFQSVDQLQDSLQEKDQEIKRLKEESLAMTEDLSRIQELELKISSILKIDPSASQISQEAKLDSTPSLTTTSAPSAVTPIQVSKQLALLEEYHDLVLENEDQINHTPSILPLDGDYEIASPFGYRSNPFGGRSGEFHNGVDFACDYGTPVHATAAGVVLAADWDAVYGRRVDIDHGSGIVTFYAHNSQLLVEPGDIVEKGEVIAYSGNSGRSTGAHLHYGALVNGKSIDPLVFTEFTKEQ